MVTNVLFTLKFWPKLKGGLNQLQLNISYQIYVSSKISFPLFKFFDHIIKFRVLGGGDWIKEIIIKHNILDSHTC